MFQIYPLDIIRFVGSRVFIILTAAEDGKEFKKLGGLNFVNSAPRPTPLVEKRS